MQKPEGSVTKHLKYGGIFIEQRIANLLLCVYMKEFWKSSIFDEVVKIWNLVAYVFGPPIH